MLGDDAGLTAAVLAAQDGDEDAFRTVYRAVQPRLLGYIRTLVGEPDAEDVASESWLQIARDLDRFSGDADRFRGWAARIARNRALDHLRMRGRRPAIGGDETELSEKPAGSDTADEAIEALATGRTMSLIAQLPQDQAEAVVLRVVVGLDAKSAAQTLGKRPGAVRTAAHRGLKRLAELLRTDGADAPDAADGAGRPGGDGGPPAAGSAEGSLPRGGGPDGGVGAPRGPADDTAPAQSPQANGAGRTAELGAVPAQRPSRTGLVAPAGVTHSRLWTQKDM
ncbi:RNA polymerase sigma factor [Streptomyces sp. NPDC050529]|uniref:RNA polymerase sigma factor n=1 Tax=unclassified Streptomyces TaxID=2593676 RepID=UPI002DD9694C|nr:RNA polymerase sigma factor [Streptomyces sp. NBC_01022]WRZ83923.1 RNA polymerase sigma factor [Streptomyces sp. NBC_01022]